MAHEHEVALENAEENAEAARAHPFAGQHLLLAYESCAADLEDEAALDAAMRRAIAASGATVLGTVARRFAPQGLTLLYVLAESHASLHTYPEQNQAEVASLYVSSSHENQGIGRKLIQFVENRARELGFRDLLALATQAFTYFQSKANFVEGTPDDLPPARRDAY